MITSRQKNILSYYLTRASFLGIGFSLIFDRGLQDSWLCALLGILIGLVIVFTYKKILDNKKGSSLIEVLNSSKGGLVIKIIFGLFAFYILFQSLLAVEIFITSFFLIVTPPFYVILPLIVLAAFITLKGLKNISRVGESIFLFSLVVPFIIMFTLFRYTDVSNFLPVLTISKSSFFYSAFMFGVFSSVPNMLLLNVKNDGQGLIKTYLLNAFSILMVIVVITAIFGPTLTDIYRYPEYMVLKRIKALAFIEKIENIASTIWIIDEFIMIALSSFTLYSLLPKKHQKKLGLVLAITMFYITSFTFGENYVSILYIYYQIPWIYFGFFVLLAIPLYFMTRKKIE